MAVQGVWLSPTSEERQLSELAGYYHEECEMFDRSVCTGSRSGIAVPATGPERSAIDAHAREVRDWLYDIAVLSLGFTEAEWQREIVREAQRIAYRKRR